LRRQIRSLCARGASAYDGLVSSSLARATFTRMQDGTAEEYALIHAREAAYNRALPVRVLDAVRALGAAEPDPGSRTAGSGRAG
jgi:hypothetical protein